MSNAYYREIEAKHSAKGERCSLEALDTFGNSHLVCPNICIKYQTCENFDSSGHRHYKRIMKEKSTMFHKFVCCQMHNKRLQLKFCIICFSKAKLFQRGPYHLTMFYTLQQLSIACLPSNCFAKNDFEKLPIVSSAFIS